MWTATHNLPLLVLSAMGAAAWLHCLVCPRRHLALLPSHTRPNLFAGD
ncbi:MAG TPA: hypothetical protein VFQ00_00600 [Terriglobales bacterium]|nr:hypothetical protein [Terriglobales bacterium]